MNDAPVSDLMFSARANRHLAAVTQPVEKSELIQKVGLIDLHEPVQTCLKLIAPYQRETVRVLTAQPSEPDFLRLLRKGQMP